MTKLSPYIPKIKPILTIKLTDAEFKRAVKIGVDRWKRDKNGMARERKLGHKGCRQINVQGAIGEVVFAKMHKFKMEENTDPRKGGIDFRCENGITIDVKHTENTTDPKLRNPAYKIGKEYHADVYVLIVGAISGSTIKYGMMGWAFHGELMKKENIITGSCTLPARKLRRDLGDFRKLIGRQL